MLTVTSPLTTFFGCTNFFILRFQLSKLLSRFSEICTGGRNSIWAITEASLGNHGHYLLYPKDAGERRKISKLVIPRSGPSISSLFCCMKKWCTSWFPRETVCKSGIQHASIDACILYEVRRSDILCNVNRGNLGIAHVISQLECNNLFQNWLQYINEPGDTVLKGQKKTIFFVEQFHLMGRKHGVFDFVNAAPWGSSRVYQ